MLLGRDSELRRIDELVATVSSGSGAVAILEGAAGIGKTALLGHAVRRAADAGFLVLRAAGAQMEREYAFGVVRELFAKVVAPGRGSADLLEGAAGLAAGPLGLVADTTEAAEGWGDPASAAMHGLYWLTARLSERGPVLVAVDDAHWADEMSLRFVLYLARRLDDLPVLVLVATRSADRDEGGLLAQIGVLPELTVLRPAPLTAQQAARLIERGVPQPDDRFVTACHEATRGNPFLLAELVGRLRVEGASGSAADAERVAGIAPQAIVRWVSARLVALGGRAERLAFAYVVLGSGASLSDASELAGLEPSVAAAKADALIGANILTAELPHEFVHSLVRAAVDDVLPAARRAAWQTRAARLAADRGAPLAVIAAHLLASDPGQDSWAIDLLRGAAREASASGAPASAASYLERALREAPPRELRAELLFELGQVQLHAGLAGATQHMREARDLHDDPCRRAEISLALGRALFSTGEHTQAQESFRQGLAELPDGEDDLFLELRGWYTADSQSDPQLTAATQARLQSLADDASPGRTRVERLTLAHLAYRSARSGDRPAGEVVRLARRALADGALLPESGSDMGPFSAACHALSAAGETDMAVSELDRAVALSQRRGARDAFAWLSHLRGITLYTRGDLIPAMADLETAIKAYTDWYSHVLPDTRAFLALCLMERDDLPGAAATLGLPGDNELATAQQRPSTCSYLCALGRLRAARGDLREGLDALLACEQWIIETNAPNPAANVAWRADAALLAARLGAPDQAREMAAENLVLARAFGAAGAIGIALRTCGLIDAGAGGLEQLGEAVTLLDGSGMYLQLARAVVEQGAALRRAGRRRDALAALRRGLDLAARCGGVTLARRAREELLAAGARPRRERISGADALTASELRVARMAATGLTNPEIAQALFITRKTVTVHLTHTYQKLDIESRAELARSLGEHLAQDAGPLVS